MDIRSIAQVDAGNLLHIGLVESLTESAMPTALVEDEVALQASILSRQIPVSTGKRERCR